LNALLDKAAGSDTPVGELSDEELRAELERRKLRRDREEVERRDREAAERAARVRAAERAGADPSGKSAGRNAASQKKSAPPPPSSRAQSQARRPPPPAPPGSERRLRELYAQLEVPYGAPFDEVKKSFRRLMRKYHPDLHVGDPVKHRTATQLTMSLTQAYNELEVHLSGGRRSP
jgi:DnaJ-domain-containing protein 1